MFKICDFTSIEIEKIKGSCNFTNEELICFELKAKNFSNLQIAYKMNISVSKVGILIRRIRHKTEKVLREA